VDGKLSSNKRNLGIYCLTEDLLKMLIQCCQMQMKRLCAHPT
jgi:hypothetical protein